MLRVLGEMRIEDVALRFRSRRATELLGLLAVGRPEGLSRVQAAATLWPDAEPERAAHNLRQTIVYLREALAGVSPEAGTRLHADRAKLTLDLPVDAREFLRLAGEESGLWSVALGLDAGPLLAGIEGEWADRARAIHEAARLDVLIGLAQARKADDPAESLRLANLAVETDPLLERARRAAMEAHVALRERARAVEEFAAYDRLLRSELGLGASPQLREIAFGEHESGEGPLPGGEAEPALTPTSRLLVAIGAAPGYEASERFGTGIATLRRSLAGGEIAAPDVRATAWAWIARFEFGIGDWTSSVEHARLAVATAHGGGVAAFARIQLARVLAWTGGAEEARPLAETVLRAAKSRRDVELGAEALLTLAATAWHRGDLRLSARLYARAGRWAIRADSPAHETRAFLSLSSLRFRIEGPQAAIASSIRAADAARRSGIPSLTAHARGDLARYREGIGELEEASKGYAAALVATEGGRNPLARGQTLTYMGDLETRLGRPESAIVLHEEAVALRRVAGDRVALATSLRGLGKALLALDRVDEARAALVESIRLFDATGAIEALPTARLPLAHALLVLGERREARTQAALALREWGALGAVSREVQVADGSLSETAITTLRAAFDDATLPI